VLFALLALLVTGFAVRNALAGDEEPKPRPAPVLHDVRYLTGGSAQYGDVTMATPGGGTKQENGVDIPLRLEDASEDGRPFSTFRAGEFLYLSVQNGEERGTVSCSIEVDGRVVASNSSQGGFAIATCKATV
jgi:hypothetical protein